MEVELRNLGTVNKNLVTLKNGYKEVNLYFSYKTLVAVNNVVSENDWSMTTGKLLNELQPNKKARVPHKQVLKEAEKQINWVIQG